MSIASLTVNKKTIYFIFAVILFMFSHNFYRANFLPNDIIAILRSVVIAISILLGFKYFFTKSRGFNLPMQLISLSVIVSLFLAKFSWGQSFTSSIMATSFMFFFLTYFFLLKAKINIYSIEKIIIFFGLLYIPLYFFQLYNTDTVYFGYQESFDDFRFGITRIIFPATGVFIALTFLSLNKYTSENKFKWLIIYLICIAVVFMQSTRQMIAAVLLISLFHFSKMMKFSKKTIFTTLIVISILYITIANLSESKYFEAFQKKNESNLSEGNSYSRLICAAYYLTEFSPDIYSRILGNGVPHKDVSDYGKRYSILSDSFLDMSDVGIIGFYAMFGIIGVIGFVWIWILSFKKILPLRFVYLKYYLWYLLLTSLTSFSVYHYYFLGTTILIIYSYQYLLDNPLNEEKAIVT